MRYAHSLPPFIPILSTLTLILLYSTVNLFVRNERLVSGKKESRADRLKTEKRQKQESHHCIVAFCTRHNHAAVCPIPSDSRRHRFGLPVQDECFTPIATPEPTTTPSASPSTPSTHRLMIVPSPAWNWPQTEWWATTLPKSMPMTEYLSSL